MNPTLQSHLDNLQFTDRELQNKAFVYLLEATSQPVDWAYAVWDDMVANLRHKDNHVRAIAAQLLCNLSLRDPQARMLKDFDALLAVTRDERFVTARHCMQSLWKVGVAGKAHREKLIDGLESRFRECITKRTAP